MNRLEEANVIYEKLTIPEIREALMGIEFNEVITCHALILLCNHIEELERRLQGEDLPTDFIVKLCISDPGSHVKSSTLKNQFITWLKKR